MFSVGKKETTPYIYAFICKVGKYGTDILMNWSPYSNLFCAVMKNWTDNFSLSFCNASKCYEDPWPILRQSIISIPPENVSKLEVFWRFQGVLKCSMDLNGLKTYTRALTSSKRFLKTFNFIYLRFFFCNFVPVEERINGIIRKMSVSQLSSNKRERHWRKLSWGINWFDKPLVERMF